MAADKHFSAWKKRKQRDVPDRPVTNACASPADWAHGDLA
jgi:hypothetical protein